MSEKPQLNSAFLEELVTLALQNSDGFPAMYIPELANVDQEITAIAIQPIQGDMIYYSNRPLSPITLQSTAKLIPLIGLLEEFGLAQLKEWVKLEPSGDDFASISRLERFGPKPSNPMLNAGAITLCSYIPGDQETAFGWLQRWVNTLFQCPLPINPVVCASEKRTGDRNRAIGFLLQSRQQLGKPVNDALDLYFALCSYEATINQMTYLPTVLANKGIDPVTHTRILSEKTCAVTLALMATCGLYDESGAHMVKTGIPAKSGVSGYTIASLPGKAGIVVLSPRVNGKGNSIRGEIMLEALSQTMGWHFALP
ncbi:MAG: glutaminase A [Legionellaceae bacterium]|nr:glutaminase A [Legionellaceae bacterium]